jgi:PAS domain S-box-containing protein
MITNELSNEQLVEQVRALQDRIHDLEQSAAVHSQTEDALKTSEKNLSAILEQNADGIVIVDEEGAVLYVNPAAEKLFGKRKEEFIGYPFGFPVSADKAEASIIIRQGDLFCDAELRVVQVQWRQRPAFQLSVRDVTAHKRIEQALKAGEANYRGLFNTILDGVYKTNRDDIVTMINPAAAQILGYSPGELIGKPFTCFWLDIHDREAYLPLLRRNKSVTLYPVRAKNKNEEFINLELTSHILEDEQGNFLGHEGILRDVTERLKLEEQLRQSQKFEAIGTLAAGVAHDFNNILTAILGYGHLTLMKMREDDPLRINVNHMLEASQRATALTQSLLAFSRKQPVNLALIDLNEIVAEFEKFLKRLLRENIELATICAARVLNIMVDRGQIEQVLMNLVANARDAMPDGGRLTIETGEVTFDSAAVESQGFGQAGEYALLMVTDTGTGMDEITRQKVFEPFFTTKEVGKGTGLGLAMAYGIVKKHEGHIHIYSEVGIGTTFKIYFPLAGSAMAAEENTEALAEPVRGGTETVLVAEDDPALRSLSSTILTHFGYTVIEAVDGQDAIMKYIEHKDVIRLVVLDGIMPKKNGWQAYEEIRTMAPAMKVVFMSGYSEDVFRGNGVLEKGFTYLLKPVTPSELLKKVREVLDT